MLGIEFNAKLMRGMPLLASHWPPCLVSCPISVTPHPPWVCVVFGVPHDKTFKFVSFSYFTLVGELFRWHLGHDDGCDSQALLPGFDTRPLLILNRVGFSFPFV